MSSFFLIAAPSFFEAAMILRRVCPPSLFLSCASGTDDPAKRKHKAALRGALRAAPGSSHRRRALKQPQQAAITFSSAFSKTIGSSFVVALYFIERAVDQSFRDGFLSVLHHVINEASQLNAAVHDVRHDETFYIRAFFSLKFN
jgi:hypothetical protein